MDNVIDTLLSQYANSPTIVSLIDSFNKWIDPKPDIDKFFNDIWNIDTATKQGLDIWGRIVVISRYLEIQEHPVYLGFDEAFLPEASLTGPQPFNQAPMYGGPSSTKVYELTDDAYRKLIMVKAMTNITDCTIGSLNSSLTYLFGKDRCYVKDLGGMKMQYVFHGPLSDVEYSIVSNQQIISRPPGVRVDILQLDH